MKYIMLKTKAGQKIPIIFPEHMVHSEVASAITRSGQIPNVIGVDSAGYCKLDGVHCFGESSTLDLNHKMTDASIIQTYDYLHGF